MGAHTIVEQIADPSYFSLGGGIQNLILQVLNLVSAENVAALRNDADRVAAMLTGLAKRERRRT